MATATWVNAAGGFWDDPTSWSTMNVPVAGDTVDLTDALSGAYVVTITSADAAASTVNIGTANAQLFVSSGYTLTANAINLSAGELRVSGIVSGATITNSGGTFRSASGELDNVSWNGALALDGAQSASYDNLLTVKGLTMVSGSTLDITGYNAELDISGSQTLSAGGAPLPIVMGGAGRSDYLKVLGKATLTLTDALVSDAKGAHVFIEDDGNGGAIVNAGDMTFGDPLLKPTGTGEIMPGIFKNYGTITISYQTLDITGGYFNGTSNVGGFTNEATGAILMTGARLTVHDTGTILSLGGDITVSNKSGLTVYHAATGTGIINLSGGSFADLYQYTGSVAFGDATDRLYLESASGPFAFKAQIQDFQIGDIIDFRGVAYAAGDYVTVAANAVTGVDAVAIHNLGGGVVASFNLFSLDFAALYNGSHFTLNQDASGGLVVGLARHVVNDFNGDGKSDVLWRSSTQLSDWTTIAGLGTLENHFSATPIAGLTIVGVGDFNNDGTSDILLQGAATATAAGALKIWNMSGGFNSGAPIAVGGPTMALAWKVAAVGDFNGDGTSDVLWSNGASVEDWKIVNDHYVSFTSHAAPGAGWSLKGVGDFNGDGTTDILWQNAATHQLQDWQMKNGLLQSIHTQSPPTTWVYQGIGDFRGNGTDEALLKTAAGGLWAINMTTGSWINLGNPVIPAGFAVAAIGDYNGDGVSDVLLYNKATHALDYGQCSSAGHIASWVSAGTQTSGWNFVA